LSNEKVFVRAKPQPAWNARLIIADVVVGGALARPNGFSKWSPHKSTLTSTWSIGVKNFGRDGWSGIFKPSRFWWKIAKNEHQVRRSKSQLSVHANCVTQCVTRGRTIDRTDNFCFFEVQTWTANSMAKTSCHCGCLIKTEDDVSKVTFSSRAICRVLGTNHQFQFKL